MLYTTVKRVEIWSSNKVKLMLFKIRDFDTIEANHQLGFSADERTYDIVLVILNHFSIKRVKLLTNNPKKLESPKGD